MPIDEVTHKSLSVYINKHLATEDWHIDFFSFLDNAQLAKRLGEEFCSTRLFYKLLEAFGANEILLRMQIRFQILAYASIYEAVLHHILFTQLKDNLEVEKIRTYRGRKIISIPKVKLEKLQSVLSHNGEDIIPTYEKELKHDETKIRFDKKVECALKLNLIEDWLYKDLIEIYEARNAIHIHAELRKNLDYQLELSKKAYLRMQPFKEQIISGLNKYFILKS